MSTEYADSWQQDEPQSAEAGAEGDAPGGDLPLVDAVAVARKALDDQKREFAEAYAEGDAEDDDNKDSP